MERRHPLFDRITLDPNKCMGKPCIRGLRIPVASILGYLSAGMTIDDILREWHELEPEDIYQALGYAAWAMEERVLLPPLRTDTPTVARLREVLAAIRESQCARGHKPPTAEEVDAYINQLRSEWRDETNLP